MQAKPQPSRTDDLFRQRLENLIDMRHELVRLAHRIDWARLEETLASCYADFGRPAHPVRLMVGLHLLKHMFGESDEAVCAKWRENPYWQYFCGEEYFRHDAPIARSDMTHFRLRVGEEPLVGLLTESLAVAHGMGALRLQDTERVAVDTTVQEKAVAFPTDAKLLLRAVDRLGATAKQEGVQLRQSYVRVAKREAIKVGRYRHAKQMKRAKKAEKKLRTFLGRLIRDIRRKTEEGKRPHALEVALSKASRILHQQRQDKNKLLSWHAPEVECIGKGKAHKPYEFGNKVSLATNVNPAPGGQFILHARALHGNPYDGHTLKAALDDVERIVGRRPERGYVDKGYQGHEETQTKIYRSGQKRGVFGKIKKELKRRSAIEPVIGHAKNDGHLGRNYLRGVIGDKINALYAAIGFNFRQLLRFLRLLLRLILATLRSTPCQNPSLTQA